MLTSSIHIASFGFQNTQEELKPALGKIQQISWKRILEYLGGIETHQSQGMLLQSVERFQNTQEELKLRVPYAFCRAAIAGFQNTQEELKLARIHERIANRRQILEYLGGIETTTTSDLCQPLFLILEYLGGIETSQERQEKQRRMADFRIPRRN